MSATPKINDQFWFDLSADIVNNSISRFNDAATRLYNFIVWIYSIFTASAILSFKINQTVDWLIYITPLPFLLIVFAGVSALNAQMPVPITFDPRIPALIEEAYKVTIKEKIRAFKIAYALVTVGSLMTSLIIFYSFVLTKKESNRDLQFNTSYFITKDSTAQIAISGNLQAKLSVKCFVHAEDSVTKKDTLAASHLFETSDSGEFEQNINTSLKSKNYKVILEWSQNNTTTKLARLSTRK